jgi:tRNA-splicing ligase RtcB (3'-phosphate/5'-hydroxy nucleic acid ligase)
MKQGYHGPMERIDEYRWRIPKGAKPGMLVDGIIFADRRLIDLIRQDNAPDQVANVACLPGIVGASYAMPDIHWGYGFCIGGLAATDVENGGVVSPGGVGYDINCGVRLLRTDLTEAQVRPRLQALVDNLFRHVPCGVGVGGEVRFSEQEERRLMTQGSAWVVDQGFGREEDVAHTEAHGALDGADPGAVSDRAFQRGRNQCGTLGSGNHFVEVQVIDELYDAEAARRLGLEVGAVTAMIHSGSRGLGHQVCEDSLRLMEKAMAKYGLHLPDRQLAAAPVNSPEGQRYLGAMRAAANYAWANRQILTHHVRAAFAETFAADDRELGLDLIYDVAHNIAKIEQHRVGNTVRTLCVHRKGATRAFGPGHPELPETCRDLGQPVIIPGDMGRASYLLLGTEAAMRETFGTTCHGAGRVMSRQAAIRAAKGRSIRRELADRGIIARSHGRHALDEEQPDAYKDVNLVVDVVHQAGLARRVCRMRPMGVIKG